MNIFHSYTIINILFNRKKMNRVLIYKNFDSVKFLVYIYIHLKKIKLFKKYFNYY